MLGLLILICLYIALGFLLAWITGIVAREEMEIMTGVIIMVVTGVVNIAMGFLFASIAPGLEVWLGLVTNYLVLTLMINLFGKLSWKHSFIIAAVFTAVLFVVSLLLVACAAAVA